MINFKKKRIHGIQLFAVWIMVMIGCVFYNADCYVVNAKEAFDEEYVTSDSWITPAVIHEEEDVPVIVKRGASASSFDARNNGWITPVKNQGNYETCWSFATAAAIEANLIKNGLAGSDVDISENSIAYFFYNRETDKLGYTKGDYNMIVRTGYDYLSAAGTLQGTGISLVTGAGILTEGQSPYLTKPDASLCYGGDYAVKNLYLYNYNTSNLQNTVQKVKQAIMDHGAVATGMFFSQSYYDKDKASYYCPIKSGNHAVTIVGWDDEYSKDKYGCYIIQAFLTNCRDEQYDKIYNETCKKFKELIKHESGTYLIVFFFQMKKI